MLDYLADRAEHSSSAGVLDIIQRVLDVTADSFVRSQDALTQALPLLSHLHALLPHSATLQSLLASGTEGSLPVSYDGHLPARSFSEWNVAALVPLAAKRWALRLEPVPPLSVESFIAASKWTDATVDILTTLVYRHQSARAPVIAWLESPDSTSCTAVHLVKIVFALYDSAREGDTHLSSESESLGVHFARLVKVVKNARLPQDVCSKAAASVASIVATHAPSRSRLLKLLSKELGLVAPEKLSQHSLFVSVRLIETNVAEARQFGEHLLDIGLRWAVRHFADNGAETDASRAILSSLGNDTRYSLAFVCSYFVLAATLIRVPIPVKSHLVEPVIATVIQERLNDTDAVYFVRLLAASTNIKVCPITMLL